ncbi:MAG: Holliday junction branch migration protein RuvA [Bacteroidales bacterium]|nr:Holliday junction branch migration protein RuvA [Bacteroidales bacterium]
MYAFISGKLVEKNPAYVVIDVHGVGYMIHISLNTFSAIGNSEEVKLYTHLAVREDAHILYGFHSQREKELFLQLITVSGVGANTARMILSSLSTDEAIEAIVTGKANILQSVKGIGTKTAQRIVIDLRDKVGKSDGFSEKSNVSYNTIKEEALSGLLILGFNKVAAEKTLEKIFQSNPTVTVEKLIKEALKVL